MDTLQGSHSSSQGCQVSLNPEQSRMGTGTPTPLSPPALPRAAGASPQGNLIPNSSQAGPGPPGSNRCFLPRPNPHSSSGRTLAAPTPGWGRGMEAAKPPQSGDQTPSSEGFPCFPPEDGAPVALGQTRPARWPPSRVFPTLSSPLPLLPSHIPLLRLQPSEIPFSPGIAALSTHGRGRGVTLSPTVPAGDNPPLEERGQTAESHFAEQPRAGKKGF